MFFTFAPRIFTALFGHFTPEEEFDIRYLVSTFIAIILCLPLGAFAQSPELLAHYQSIRAEAIKIAGEPLDMPTRAQFLYGIYDDSNGNDAFPLVALHGALWGFKFFELTGPFGDWLTKWRYVFSPSEVALKQQELREFSLSFQEINRSVFIDTYSNYYFTKQYGKEPGADQIIKAPLLAALNRVHDLAANHQKFSDAEKESTFSTCLYYEQELTVGPRVRLALDKFNDSVVETFALRPIVHFKYFWLGQELVFHDFSDQQERIAKATTAYEIANRVGWKRVIRRMKNYHVIPAAFFEANDQQAYLRDIKAQILK